LAVAAGLATLKLLSRHGTYEKLQARGKYLEEGLHDIIAHSGLRATVNRVGSMMTLFFGVTGVNDPDQARKCDRDKFRKFFHAMLKRRIYLPPAPFEAMFISLAHSKDDLAEFLKAFEDWVARSNG
jgi:glutamate-1-semialdehyde 2,1-aminomutase